MCITNVWNNHTVGNKGKNADVSIFQNEWSLHKLKAKAIEYRHCTLVDRIVSQGKHSDSPVVWEFSVTRGGSRYNLCGNKLELWKIV